MTKTNMADMDPEKKKPPTGAETNASSEGTDVSKIDQLDMDPYNEDEVNYPMTEIVLKFSL